MKYLTTYTTYTNDLFIEAQVFGEQARLFAPADNINMIHQGITYSPDQHFSSFKFRVFSFTLASCPTKLRASSALSLSSSFSLSLPLSLPLSLYIYDP